jgi:hypothetical protein
MLRVIELLKAGKPLLAYTDGGKLKARVGSHPLLPSVLAGMVGRGLVEPAETVDDATTRYELTERGRQARR